MPEFDADRHRQAREPWRVRLGGRWYTAELLSQEALLRFLAGIEQAKDANDAPAAFAAARRLWREAFPWRPSYLWRGDPVQLLLGLDPKGHEEALLSFFACHGAGAPSPTSKTGRSDSSADGPPSPSGGA